MTRRGDWIAYVGPIAFPWGQAGSRRMYGVARSLAAAGHHVVVAGGDPGPPAATRLAEVDGPGSVSHVGLGELPPAGTGLLAASLQSVLRRGLRTLRWLDAQPTKPSHVIVYGGGAQYMVHLRRWCRRYRIPLIADVVEWYSPHQLHGGLLGPPHLSAKIALRYHYPRCDGVIAISSYLERHYRERGRPVLRVPPTLDVRALALRPRGGIAAPDVLRLVYAGSPGRKDLLPTIIRAVGALEREGARIALRVYGPTPAEVRALVGGGALPDAVLVRGRLAQQEVPAALQEADFSVLVRPVARFANAGFPTKFCESLANGTPVVANLTSDLGDYLRHGREGLICRDGSAQQVVAALRTAIRLTPEQRSAMRRDARSRALQAFDFRAYAEPLGAFIAGLRR